LLGQPVVGIAGAATVADVLGNGFMGAGEKRIERAGIERYGAEDVDL